MYRMKTTCIRNKKEETRKETPNLIMVSSRLPYTVCKINGRLVFKKSVGGVATGLSHAVQDLNYCWVGWPGIAEEELTKAEKNIITAYFKRKNCLPIFLSKKQLAGFYNGYANRILWPTFHNLAIAADAKENELEYWKIYEEVNCKFAKAIEKIATDYSKIWVHDYQLLLLGKYLYKQVKTKIGFFLHIPFPKAEYLNKLRNVVQLIDSLLFFDIVGFHVLEYQKNFHEAVKSLKLKHEHSPQYIHCFMGIDGERFQQTAQSKKCKMNKTILRKKFPCEKVILTVDRLDPSKGLINRVKAIERLFNENPQLKNKVSMVMIVPHSREEIEEYAALRKELEVLIHSVNDQFQGEEWKPIYYEAVCYEQQQLTAFYQIADIAFIAPYRDGLNLVAKEYISSNTTGKGVLVLSKTAGVSGELTESILVDAGDIRSMVNGLIQGITMNEMEQRLRMDHLKRRVFANSINGWVNSFLSLF